MTKTNNLGLYIHLPFCERKCSYCDFLSFKCNDNQVVSQYIKALLKEIKGLSRVTGEHKVDSIFIGGGTPSLVSEWDMGNVLDCLKEYYDIDSKAEITIEVNPSSVTDEKMERYLKKGINRLSIGVQAFNNNVLNVLGRIHSKNDAFYCIKRAQKLGFDNINIDLMFGIPKQTMKMWKDTVREALFLKVPHISLYSLQVEEGTDMYNKIFVEKSMDLQDESVDREMYHTALKMMKAAGYSQYEISNAALPGYNSRHNTKYWSYSEYLGIGLGASSFFRGKRFKNYDNLFDYYKSVKERSCSIDSSSIEKYSEKEEMGIFVFTGLRKVDGFRLEDFKNVFNKEFFDVYDYNILNRYKDKLIIKDERIFITERGMDISNRIMAEFIL